MGFRSINPQPHRHTHTHDHCTCACMHAWKHHLTHPPTHTHTHNTHMHTLKHMQCTDSHTCPHILTHKHRHTRTHPCKHLLGTMLYFNNCWHTHNTNVTVSIITEFWQALHRALIKRNPLVKTPIFPCIGNDNPQSL